MTESDAQSPPERQKATFSPKRLALSLSVLLVLATGCGTLLWRCAASAPNYSAIADRVYLQIAVAAMFGTEGKESISTLMAKTPPSQRKDVAQMIVDQWFASGLHRDAFDFSKEQPPRVEPDWWKDKGTVRSIKLMVRSRILDSLAE